ncbi:hypothetical protein AA0121_g13562 [Alternaria tenuissima]|nr:hypothetical protein AA0121_g13562 [Alternaria tenuissima]
MDTKSADPRLSLLPRPDGTYVVTGGLGDLGLETLEFLAKKGARRIVVVSRRLLSPQQDKPALSGPLARIQQLRSTGVKIHVLKLDISEQGASARLTRELERLSFVPVSGVVHAAAVPGFGHIRRTPSGSYASVMAPKVAGALALHEAFPPGTLDFFVFFSSISGIVGTPGHAAYAASNTFLDGLAAYRRSQGCNSIAMLWTAWRGLGLASNTAVVDSELQAAGMGDITAAEAFDAWERLSGSNTEHAVVTRLEWSDTNGSVPIDLVREVAATKPSSRSVSEIDRLTGSELKARVAVAIRKHLSIVLGIGHGNIDDKAELTEIGVDSSMSIRLCQMLPKELPKELLISTPVLRRLLWDCQTVADLISGLCTAIDKIPCS